jgi:hypothetical protein
VLYKRITVIIAQNLLKSLPFCHYILQGSVFVMRYTSKDIAQGIESALEDNLDELYKNRFIKQVGVTTDTNELTWIL